MTPWVRFVGCLLSLGLLASTDLLGAPALATEVPTDAAGAAARAGDGGAEDRPPAQPAAPGKDGGQMVLVPGGRFFMGCNETVDKECDDIEKPGRTVDVDPFKIDRTEGRVGDYARCVSAGACTSDGVTMPYYDGQDRPEFAEFCNWQRSGRENHPMNCLNWNQAVAYCGWVG